MRLGQVVARNLKELMRHAADHGHAELASPEALEHACGVSKSNIYRYLSCQVSPTLDKLEVLAGAFGLSAWQLLIAGLDPSNPPVVFQTEAERRLYARLKEVGAAFRDAAGREQENLPEAPGPDPHPPGKGRRVRSPK